MLRQQLDADADAGADADEQDNNNSTYGATTHAQHVPQNADESDESDDDDDDTNTDGTGDDTDADTNADERSSLLSSLGGSFARRHRRNRQHAHAHRRNHSNASGSVSFRTLNTLSMDEDETTNNVGGNRARAGSFVSYSNSTLLLERTKQTLWYCFELFFPADDDTIDATDDGTSFDPWESPDVRRSYNGNANGSVGSSSGSNILHSATTRHRIAVIFNCVLLAIAYGAERSSFKVLVDKAGPFRLLGGSVITGLHAVVLGLGMAVGSFARSVAARNKARSDAHSDQTHHRRQPDAHAAVGKGVGVPLADLGLMAVLDSAHLLLSVISGSIIPPVLTVILVQAVVPITVFALEFIHPKGRCRRAGGVLCCLGNEEDALDGHGRADSGYQRSSAGESTPSRSNTRSSIASQATTAASSRPDADDMSISSFGRLSGRHTCGAIIITLAIVLVVSPAVVMIADPPSQHITSKFQESETKGVDPAIASTRSAWNTILFVAACVPAAASQLYKEHTLANQRQPIDQNRLNLTLSVFQSIFALIVSPLLMPLEGLASGIHWTGMYPSKATSANFIDGLRCFAGTLDEATEMYTESASCRFLWLVALIHVLSIVVAGVAVERLVYRGALRLIHICISGGFILSIVAMYSYEIVSPFHIYGYISHTTNLIAAIILLVGLQMHNSEQYSQPLFETEYEKIGEELYGDDDE